MSRYEVTSPHIRHRRSCVRWRHAAALDDPASGVDRIHRNRRGRVWRSWSDVHRRTGYQEVRERGVRRLPPSLPGIGEQRLVRRSCRRRREDAHGGVLVRDHAETRVGCGTHWPATDLSVKCRQATRAVHGQKRPGSSRIEVAGGAVERAAGREGDGSNTRTSSRLGAIQSYRR
jgi:hypothetical protein